MHDGPDIRTTVFLKGCPLRCEWCHNPETQRSRSELLFYSKKCIMCGGCAFVCQGAAHTFDNAHHIDRNNCTSCFSCIDVCPTNALERCGKEMGVEEILDVVERDKAFFGERGGITLSGGEPLLSKDVIALLAECKKRGLSVAVETCGHVSEEILRRSLPYVDLFLWDVKDTDEERHKLHTGVSNKLILENLKLADELGATIRLRCILVRGVNTNVAHYRSVANISLGLHNFEGVELIPYHAYGGTKAVFCGMQDNGCEEWVPSPEQLDEAKRIFGEYNIKVL